MVRLAHSCEREQFLIFTAIPTDLTNLNIVFNIKKSESGGTATYVYLCIEKNVSVCLCFTQNCINQDDNRIILNVFVHRFLAGFLKIIK